MTYRKLTVAGIQYEFVIGHKFTKVKLNGKHHAMFENAHIGRGVISPRSNKVTKYVVEPSGVADAILGRPLKAATCRAHGITTDKVMVNPFDAEIHDRVAYMIACSECYHDRADDI